MNVEENHARKLPRPPLVPAAAFGSPAPNQLFSTKLLENTDSPVPQDVRERALQSWLKTRMPSPEERPPQEGDDDTTGAFRGTRSRLFVGASSGTSVPATSPISTDFHSTEGSSHKVPVHPFPSESATIPEDEAPEDEILKVDSPPIQSMVLGRPPIFVGTALRANGTSSYGHSEPASHASVQSAACKLVFSSSSGSHNAAHKVDSPPLQSMALGRPPVFSWHSTRSQWYEQLWP